MKIENTSNLEIGKIVVLKNDGWVYFGDEKVQEHNLNIFTRRSFYYGIVKEDGISPVLYADLHRHSGFSLLDGAIKIKDMVRRTELYGALTDHGNMFGFLDFYNEMKGQGKKPIIGCEVYVETIDEKKESHHLILLVKDEEGYKNLIKLVSDSYDNIYKKPHVKLSELKKYKRGLICTSACLGSEVAQSLLNNNKENAEKVAKIYKQIFGDDFYIEIQRHNFLEEKEVEVKLIQLAKKLKIKVIATTDAHYPTKEDEKSHEILLCIQTKKTLEDEHWTFPGDGYYVHTSEEMYEKFKDIPEVLDNTLEIAEKIKFEIKSEILLPEFPLPDGVRSEPDYLEDLCRKGFAQKFLNPTQEYIDRIEYEIRIIKNTGYSGYFLIVQDYINWAKENDILVGPGRGSCVGSLASYCLGITDVDPIPYGLLFERFLNPERISMPDIDTDFQEDKRDLVIEYVRNKYGTDSVAKIITFGTLAAKTSIRDVAKVQGHDYAFSNRISKLIPNLTKNIDTALEEIGELKELYDTNNEIKEVIDVAKTLEGLQRHNSIHACGVVIAPSNVDNYIPTIKLLDKETGVRETVTQLTMAEVEMMGLLKMDFLGLRTMTVIKKTLDLVKTPINLYKIPFEVEVFKHIQAKNTLGVFQLESKGMTDVINKMYQDITDNHSGAELFERLIAGVSLYRPGPMDSIPDYINNMLNPKNISYNVPQLKDLLDKTYGIIVYQEQVMQIVQKLAGYSFGRADLVRKAMGKKKEEIMAQEKEVFINGLTDDEGNELVRGCIKNGISKQDAEEIWDKMAEFAKYAFNKSHATAYALIGYWTAYLSYYHPVEFITSLLNSFIGNNDKLQYYISQVKLKGFEILPPNINKSFDLFKIEDGKIRFGLKALKDVGKLSELIIEERNSGGEFTGYQDFIERMVVNQKIDKSGIEALIYSSTLDRFDGTRKEKISVLPLVMMSAQRDKKNQGQVSLFDLVEEFKEYKKIEMPKIGEYDKDEKLRLEREYAGIYISEHPIDEYVGKTDAISVAELEEDLLDTEVSLLGIIREHKTFYSKKDFKPIYSVTIEDRTGEINAVLFSDRVQKFKSYIHEGNIILIKGKFQENDFGKQIIVDTVSSPKEECIKKPLFIEVKSNKKLTNEEKNSLRSLISKDGILLKYYYNNKENRYKINYDPSSIEVLKTIHGDSSVRVCYI